MRISSQMKNRFEIVVPQMNAENIMARITNMENSQYKQKGHLKFLGKEKNYEEIALRRFITQNTAWSNVGLHSVGKHYIFKIISLHLYLFVTVICVQHYLCTFLTLSFHF